MDAGPFDLAVRGHCRRHRNRELVATANVGQRAVHRGSRLARLYCGVAGRHLVPDRRPTADR